MDFNVSCAVAGCANPVIGQCTGYKGSCGRFYCAAHSTDRLCADCARRKLEDETAQRTYKVYLQTAERLRRDLRWVDLRNLIGGFVILGVFAVLGFGIGRSDPDKSVTNAVQFGGVIIATVWSLAQQRKRRKQEKARLEEIRETKPAFPEFYKAWKEEKNKEALMTGLAIAGIIVAGAVAAAASTDREKRVSEIEEGVRRAMR